MFIKQILVLTFNNIIKFIQGFDKQWPLFQRYIDYCLKLTARNNSQSVPLYFSSLTQIISMHG